jgi:dTDP-4-dehydrorhamnose reductase
MSTELIIGLTGATGFVGKNVTPFINNLGRVVELRSANEKAKYRLNEPSNITKIKPDILIHFAMTREFQKENGEDVNYLGIKRKLDESSFNPNMKVIFLSSLSSHSNSASNYGYSKFKIENYLSQFTNVSIIRTGVICAKPEGGFEKTLKRIANIPLFLFSISKLDLHLTSIEILNESICSVITKSSSEKSNKFIVAEETPISLTHFLESRRSKFKLMTIELSIKNVLTIISFVESKLRIRVQIFDSIKSYAYPLEQRDFAWKSYL